MNVVYLDCAAKFAVLSVPAGLGVGGSRTPLSCRESRLLQ
jgi:hypothetical protein